MSTKIVETRIANKTDTTANWNATINFIPLKGEIIIYQDEDSPTRYKVGDGKTDVNSLPFLVSQPNWAQTDETAHDFIKNKPDETDALVLAMELGFIDSVVTASDGSVYTDENSNIYTL